MSNGHAMMKSICPVCREEFPEGTAISWAPTGKYSGLRMHSTCMNNWTASGSPNFSESVLDAIRDYRTAEIARKKADGTFTDTYTKKPRKSKPVYTTQELEDMLQRAKDALKDQPKKPSEDIKPTCDNWTPEGFVKAPIGTADFPPVPAPEPIQPRKPVPTPHELLDGTFEPSEPAPTPRTDVLKPETDNPITKAILDALWPTIEKHVITSVDMSQVESMIDWKMKDLTSPEPKALKITCADMPPVTVENAHPSLPELVWLLVNGFIPYVWEGAGSGKTHGALEAMKVVGCSQVYLIPCNPFSSPIELVGYTDALSKFVDKPLTLALRRAMNGEKTGLVLDEADSARPDFLPTLNGILSQKMLTLTNGETLTLPSTFFLALTGNTNMKGGTRDYNSRSPQDASVQDRLWFLKWSHDEALEVSLCNELAGAKGIRWAQYCQSIRHFAKANTTVTNVIVTLRAMLGGLKALTDGSPFSVEKIADGLIFKGVAEDTKTRVLTACPLPATSEVK